MEKPSKTFKRVIKQRDAEFLPQTDPSKPHKRRYTKTKIHWFWALVYEKQFDTIGILLLIVLAVVAGIAYVAFLVIKWLSEFFGWGLIS